MSDLVTIYFLRTALFDLLMCYLKYCHLCLNVRLTWHLSLVFSPRAEPDIKICMCVCSVTQSYLTLCPLWTVAPGSSVQGIFQGRMLEWVAISSSFIVHNAFSWSFLNSIVHLLLTLRELNHRRQLNFYLALQKKTNKHNSFLKRTELPTKNPLSHGWIHFLQCPTLYLPAY